MSAPTTIADAARTMPHTLRELEPDDETIAALHMLLGFDDDLAAEATRTPNRIRGLLTAIHPGLERVIGPRIHHPAVLDLLERYGSPTALKQASHEEITEALRPRAPPIAERLAAEIRTALDEQTVMVPGTDAAALILPSLASSLRTVLDQRKTRVGNIEELLDTHPLSQVLTSMPGNGVRTGARILAEIGDASAVPPPPPRRLRRPGARHPPLRQLHPRRSGTPARKPPTQTGLLPRRVRVPGRPGLPRLLRPEDRPRLEAQPGTDLPRPTTLRRHLPHAQKRTLYLLNPSRTA
ncbi:transposase [Actinospica durhamensis]|uniref:Transposase n=1 Tax=Actinospica durhamensis TaxID=1508375 RepID=A0A941IPR7_9ACTN|nr:transposase [Actinospica durhamensis]